LWVVEAKLLKLAFSITITNDTYKKLHNIFENLPNVHVNVYLSQHAHTFATLVNTSVGVKEMQSSGKTPRNNNTQHQKTTTPSKSKAPSNDTDIN
ncbi:1485_t:CDS:2, partial [Racocetra persica]